MKMNIKVLMVLFLRENWFLKDKILHLFNLYQLKHILNFDIVQTTSDLWYVLSKGIRNQNTVHIFSSEDVKIPKSVINFQKSINCRNLLKYHYTGSSLASYKLKIQLVVSALIMVISNLNYFVYLDFVSLFEYRSIYST